MDFDSWRAHPVAELGEGLGSNYGKSPFLSLEVFIESIACIGGVQGMYVVEPTQTCLACIDLEDG